MSDVENMDCSFVCVVPVEKDKILRIVKENESWNSINYYRLIGVKSKGYTWLFWKYFRPTELE